MSTRCWDVRRARIDAHQGPVQHHCEYELYFGLIEMTQGISPNVVILGLVSLLMGISSAMIYGLLPVFLVTVLGASVAVVGVIEGIAEDIVPTPIRGTEFGLRLTLYTIGAIVGPLIAMVLMRLGDSNFRLVFWIALSFASILVLLIWVDEPSGQDLASRRSLSFSHLRLLILAHSGSVSLTALGAALWGLQMGVTQGLLSALVADAAPVHLRGTAFGIYDCGIGFMTFLASAGAGALWAVGGPVLTFGIGSVVAIAVLVLLLLPVQGLSHV